MEEQEGRIVAMEEQQADDWQYSLRPRKLSEYIGQDKVKENLSVFIQAALSRGEALDHVLLYGPPGLGKTTLAGIIANELGVNFRVTSGPAIELQFRPVYARQISVLGSYLGDRHELESVLRMAEGGRLRPVIDRVFTLDKLAEAQDHMEGRGHFGKIVIRVP